VGPLRGRGGKALRCPPGCTIRNQHHFRAPPTPPDSKPGGGKGSRSIPQPTEILAICRDLDNSQAFKRKALTSHPDKGKRELTSTMHPMRPTQNELERFVWTHRLVNPRSQGALRTCSV
jgi:hypothetical protein